MTVTELTVNAAQLTIVDDDATPVPVTLAFTSDPDDSGPDDDTYAIGDVVEVTATFSGAITVTDGPPQLELDVGGTPKRAGVRARDRHRHPRMRLHRSSRTTRTPTGIAIVANAIGLNGASITLGGDAVTPTHAAKDADSGHKVDGVRPTLVSAETSADGNNVVLTYDESLSATTAAAGTFTVTVSSANASATPSVSAATASGLTVTLTLGTAVKAGQIVTVDYADPTAGDDANAVQDAAGNDAESLSGEAVTNKVPEDATLAGLTMTLSSATLTEGGDGVTVTIATDAGATFATDRAVALTWDGEALAANSGLIRERSGHSRVVLAAGEATGTVTLTGVERSGYTVSKTAALVASVGETEVGSENLTYADSGAAPAATIAATPAKLTEGDDITVTVTLSRAFDATDVAVALTMTDTENVVGTTLPATLAFAAGDTTAAVTLATAADMMTGNDAPVSFTLSTPGANDVYTRGTPSSASVTVYDDTTASDGITLSVSPATVAEGAGATTLTVGATVNRAAPTTATEIPISVTANTATAMTDYTATSATLTIAANARTGTATLTLTPVDDTATEADETVIIGGSVTGFTVTSAQVTILDDDEPAISLKFIETSGTPNDDFIQIDESDGTVPVTLRATAAGGVMPTRDISVTVQVVEVTAGAEEGDFKPLDGTYTFAADDFTLDTGSGSYVHTVSKDLEIIDDLTVEKIENIHIAVDTATLPPHVTTAGTVLVTIDDDDQAQYRTHTEPQRG